MNIRQSYLLLLCIAAFLGGGFSAAHAQSAFEDPGAVRSGSGKTGGDFVAVNDKIDGGIVALGSSSQVVVLFRNDAIKPITSGDISLFPSSNVSATINQNQCSLTPLEYGAVCAVALNVKGLQAGKYRIEMLVRHDGRSKLLTATISGDVESTGDASKELITDIEPTPSKIDFGKLEASRPMVSSIVLRNVTPNPLTISDMYIQSGGQAGFELEGECTTLASGQSCIVTVKWSPVQKGPSTGVLVVQHDGPTSLTSVPLTGSYEPAKASEAETFPDAVPGKGLMVSSLAAIDFGSDITSSSAITVSLVNVGDKPLRIRGIKLSNNESGVDLQPGGCAIGTTLDPVEACPLTLTWEPVREGAILDDLQIRHTGARGILVLPVRGSASESVNKDSKAIILDEYLGGVPTLPMEDFKDIGAGSGSSSKSKHGKKSRKKIDIRGALDGYSITSHGGNRAIVTGPGGSRVVFDGEETIIAGVLWKISVRRSAVQFKNGKQRVMLLFDRSLSSINPTTAQSSGESSSEQ